MRQSVSTRRGFTYIELLIVLGLFSIIASFGLALGMDTIARSSVSHERDRLVALLLGGARAAALANKNESGHGVHIDSTEHRYVLFSGSYAPNGATNRIIPFTSDHISITTSAPGTTIIFEALSGNVIEGAGTITLTNGAVTQEITLNEVGQIDW